MPVSQGKPADLTCSAEVTLHQRRRKVLLFGNIVEAVADRVWRQEHSDVDLDAEQIADGARVLGAVQALKWPPAARGFAAATRSIRVSKLSASD